MDITVSLLMVSLDRPREWGVWSNTRPLMRGKLAVSDELPPVLFELDGGAVNNALVILLLDVVMG